MSAALSSLAWGVLDCLEIALHGRIITRRVYRRPRPAVYHVHYHQSPIRRPL